MASARAMSDPPDFPMYDMYDRAEAERGWVELLELFARNVRGGRR